MIRNLLFDLGGVIMDIERSRCVDAFVELGIENAGEMLGDYVQSGPFRLIESGEIDAAGFRDEIRRIAGRDIPDAKIDEAFEAFLVEIPEHRLRHLKRLRKHYWTYLLSNTNPIMWNSKIRNEFSKLGHSLGYYFDGALTSFEAKVMKPDERIFRYAIERFDIKPAETLFLDDSQDNIDAAASLGFQTLLVPHGKEFVALLPR